MSINEIDRTIYPYPVAREDLAGQDNGARQLEETGISGLCRSAVGDHRWCLFCRQHNGGLDVERLRQMRGAYLQRRLDGNEKPEDQRELVNIDEALTLLKAL